MGRVFLLEGAMQRVMLVVWCGLALTLVGASVQPIKIGRWVLGRHGAGPEDVSGESVHHSSLRHQTTYTDSAEADRVKDLPGWGQTDFGLFSGYITVDKDKGRALFYAHAEALGGSLGKPLVLWLNGGPGCSSIGGGFMSELGPFYPKPDGKTLQRNAWSWNQFANLVFLESPAFVGFSYSNTSSDAVVGDERTAKDAHTFLLNFLERFPHFANSPLYITGESYAGHYVPQLAWQVLQGNKAGRQPHINLQGVAVGNAWTDAAIDNEGAVDFWWSHGLVSDSVATGIKAKCNLSDVGPLYAHSLEARTRVGSSVLGEKCDAYLDRAFSTFDLVNIYEIYADVCLKNRALRGVKQMAHQLSRENRLRSKSDPIPGYDPCVDNEVEAYLNLPAVQSALHARPTKWSDCSSDVDYSRKDLLTSVLPVWHKLLQADLKLLVYSGDVDGIVPVVGSRRWVAGLGLNTIKDWTAWLDKDGQVGGFLQVYQGLVFATVRNAGHMVPYTQPDRAFSLLSWFITTPHPSRDLGAAT